MSREDELRKILGKSSKASNKAPTKNMDQLRSILGKPSSENSQSKRSLWEEAQQIDQDLGMQDSSAGRPYMGSPIEDPQQILHGATEGALGVGNLVQAPVGLPWWLARKAGVPLPEMPMVSELGEKGLKGLGYDLSANKPKTLGGKVTREAASFGVPGGSAGRLLSKGAEKISKYAPKIAKGLDTFANFVGKEKALSKEGARVAAMGAGTGATVGALQEGLGEGNEGLASLIGGLGLPLGVAGARGIAKKGPRISPSQQRVQDLFEEKMLPQERKTALAAIEKNNKPENFVEGFNPTTAEVADSPTLANYERALTGQTTSPEYAKISQRQMEQNQAILDRINDMVPEGYNADQAQDFIRSQYNKLNETVAATEELAGTKAAETVLENFINRETPQEAGKQIQRTIGEEQVAPLKADRRKEAKEAYGKVEESEQRILAPKGEQYLERKLRNAKGSMKTMLQKLQDSLRPEEMREAKINGVTTKGAQRIGEVEGAKQFAQDLLAKAEPDSPRSAILSEYIDELKLDLEEAPLVKDASKKFKEASVPISKYTEHPTIGPDIAKNVRGKFLTKQADVINKYVKGKASKQYASELYQHVKNDKRTMDAIEGYINGDVLDGIIDGNTGRVNQNRLNSWKTANPGAFELYPKLDKKLENTSNATKFYHDLVKENAKKVKNFEKSAAAKFLNKDPDRVAASVLSTQKPIMEMDEIVSELSKDKTGNALKGYQRSFVEHMMKNFKTLGADNTNVSIKKFNDLILNKTKALSKLFDKEQMSNLNKVHKSLLARNKKLTLGEAKGSPTAPKANTMIDMFLSGLGKGRLSKIPFAGPYLGTAGKMAAAAFDKFSEFKNRDYDELLVKTILEPEFAKVIFTNIENKKPKEVEKMVSDYIKRSAIRSIEAANREDED